MEIATSHPASTAGLGGFRAQQEKLYKKERKTQCMCNSVLCVNVQSCGVMSLTFDVKNTRRRILDLLSHPAAATTTERIDEPDRERPTCFTAGGPLTYLFLFFSSKEL